MTTVVIIYACAGVVTVILLRRRADASPARMACDALFWPFVLPVMLGAPVQQRTTEVEGRLLNALAELAGPAETVLRAEVARIRAAVQALTGTRRRLTHIDALLAEPAFDPARAEATLTDLSARCAADDPRLASVRGRLTEIARLRSLRDQTLADLEFAELKMEELCAQVQLLRLGDREGQGPEALELIREVAGAVEAVNEALAA